jgi:hypothetical protein
MRLSTTVIGASLLVAGVALGAYHRRVEAIPSDQPSSPASHAPILDRSNLPNDSSLRAPYSAPVAGDASTNARTRVAMKNVDFHLTDKIVVHITSLEGRLTPKPGEIPVFDDKYSFSVDAYSADLIVSTRALANDLNYFVFAKPDAPLKGLKVATKGNDLIIKGRFAAKGGLPFESDGVPSVTPDGMIRIHTVEVKALHVPINGLMDKLGLSLSKLMDTSKVQGVSVDHNDLILDPQRIFPPPPIHGRLTSIQVRGDSLALEFRSPHPERSIVATLANPCPARNFLALRGGTVRFGKLTMNDAELDMVDTTPADPFDFSLDLYQKQLKAGVAKTMQDGGLCVQMPDLDKIAGSSRSSHPKG